jgi:hypothetical protein
MMYDICRSMRTGDSSANTLKVHFRTASVYSSRCVYTCVRTDVRIKDALAKPM